jgi:hypothetical protein
MISKKELAMGTEHEMEHTDDPREARKIALNHLREHADYYTKLEKLFPEKGKNMAKKKLSELAMPEKKASDQEGEDLLGDLTAEPMDGEMAPMNEELAKASDDELVKELESRGFKVEGPKEAKAEEKNYGEMEEGEMPEEVSPSNEALGSSEERSNIA